MAGEARDLRLERARSPELFRDPALAEEDSGDLAIARALTPGVDRAQGAFQTLAALPCEWRWNGAANELAPQALGGGEPHGPSVVERQEHADGRSVGNGPVGNYSFG